MVPNLRTAHRLATATVVLMALLLCASLAGAQANQLVVYSGRTEPLVGPLLERFTQETGIKVQVRYGDTAELAATIMEEGRNARPDIFFAQDAGALGALAAVGRLQPLPDSILTQVPAHLRSPDGLWVGTSGRARVVAYNTRLVKETELPDSIWAFTDPKWRNRIAWAPTNGSFQAFVTALRLLEGDRKAEEWLRGIMANRPVAYSNNTAIIDALGRGEVQIGFVNHYYLFRFLEERGESFPVRNHYTTNDAGAIINIAGVGILFNSTRVALAEQFIQYLLSEAAQQYFTDSVYEYPVVVSDAIKTHSLLLPLDQIKTPTLDLSRLEDLEGTLMLLDKVGAL